VTEGGSSFSVEGGYFPPQGIFPPSSNLRMPKSLLSKRQKKQCRE